jgi:hypothetical protein
VVEVEDDPGGGDDGADAPRFYLRPWWSMVVTLVSSASRQMSESGDSMENGSAIVLMPVSVFTDTGLGFLVDRPY